MNEPGPVAREDAAQQAAATPAPAVWFTDAAAFERLTGPLWEPVSRAAVAAAELRPGDRVLDLCAGAGASAVQAARAVGPGGHVEAVDLAEALLEAGRRRAEDEGLSWLVFTHGDAGASGPPEHDVLLWVLGLFFLPDPVAGGRRAVARVRPGGRVVVSTWATGAMAAVLGPLAQAGRRTHPDGPGGASSGSADSGSADDGPGAPGVPSAAERLSTHEALLEWAGEVGLVDTRVQLAPHRLVVTPKVVQDLVRVTAAGALVAGLDPAVVADAVDAAASGGQADATTLVLTARRPAP